MLAARLSSLLLVVAMALAALGAFSATPGDESEVRGFVAAFAESFQTAQGPEELTRFYARDGSHIGSKGERITGPAAIARYFEPLVPRQVSLEIHHLSFISERVALVDGLFRVASPGSRESGSGSGSVTTERFALVTRQTSQGLRIVASRMAPE